MEKEKNNELGFGTKTANQKTRLLNRQGTFTVERRGQSKLDAFSWYHHLLNMHLLKFLLLMLLGYVIMNLAFTFLYLIVGVQHLGGVMGNSFFEKFCEAFFFSTQTFTTVGYGRVNPQGLAANIIAALESFVGLLAFAVATGLLYGRFARPKANFIFSDNALIAPYAPTGKALMLRVANQLEHLVIEIEATVSVAYLDKNLPGVRKFITLKLELSKIYYLPTLWTIVHPIDEESLFYNKTEKEIDEMDVEIFVMIKAYDDAFSQTVHSRTSYKQYELVWNAKFVQVLFTTDDGKPYFEIDKMGNFEQL